GSASPTHTYELSTCSRLFIVGGGAAAAAVAPSPPPPRPQTTSLRFEAFFYPSAWRQRALPLAAAAAPRGGAVASSSPAPRRWRPPEGRRDRARPTTRRSSCGDELLSVSYHLIIFSKQNSAEVGNSNKQIGKSSYRRSVWTLSSLKLSFLEINDLTSQLTNLRKRLAISRFGNEAITKGPQTAWPKQGNK
ncbi:unnamed protein product, partial [Urochloa humidicola]